MIVTVTLNPALDQTIELTSELVPGDVLHASGSRTDAAGKGVNVARAIAAAGVPVLAVLPLSPTDPYGEALHAVGLSVRTIPVTTDARTNLTLVDPAGVTTKINLPGGVRTGAEWAALEDAVVDAATGADWLVLSGSLPPGVPGDAYARLIAAVRSHVSPAPRIAVDAAGAALTAACTARPDLIKPNESELAELSGTAVEGLDAAVADARLVVRGGVGAVLVTLGGDGAVLVDADGALVSDAPRIRVRSTVGAGDSALAGYVLAAIAGADAEERLANAVRYGSAAAALPGTQPPTADDLGTEELHIRAY